jgi:hypothetical protein
MTQPHAQEPSAEDLKAAQRLARTIASDILLYNREKVIEGLRNDTLFDVLAEEIREGRGLFEERVSAEICARHNLLDRALVDVLIHSQAHITCPLW